MPTENVHNLEIARLENKIIELQKKLAEQETQVKKSEEEATVGKSARYNEWKESPNKNSIHFDAYYQSFKAQLEEEKRLHKKIAEELHKAQEEKTKLQEAPPEESQQSSKQSSSDDRSTGVQQRRRRRRPPHQIHEELSGHDRLYCERQPRLAQSRGDETSQVQRQVPQQARANSNYELAFLFNPLFLAWDLYEIFAYLTGPIITTNSKSSLANIKATCHAAHLHGGVCFWGRAAATLFKRNGEAANEQPNIRAPR